MFKKYRFNGRDQIRDGDGQWVDTIHPLKGAECELIEYTGMAKSGYDTLVSVERNVWVEAYANFFMEEGTCDDIKTARQTALDISEDMLHKDEDHVRQEVNLNEELEPLNFSELAQVLREKGLKLKAKPLPKETVYEFIRVDPPKYTRSQGITATISPEWYKSDQQIMDRLIEVAKQFTPGD